MSGREIITLQIGSVANYVGAHYWNLEVCGAPCNTRFASNDVSTLFSHARTSNTPISESLCQQDEYERRYAEGAPDEIDAAAASGLETDPSCIFRQGLTYSVRARAPIRLDCPCPLESLCHELFIILDWLHSFWQGKPVITPRLLSFDLTGARLHTFICSPHPGVPCPDTQLFYIAPGLWTHSHLLQQDIILSSSHARTRTGALGAMPDAGYLHAPPSLESARSQLLGSWCGPLAACW